MVKEIIISSTASQNRIAITEDAKLVDFFVEHPEKDRMVGNIYLGKVARVLPGIRAVFVNIGLKHDAFLHFSDIGDTLKENLNFVDDDYVAEKVADDDKKNKKESSSNDGKEQHSKPRIPRLKKGQEVLVQIIKEPVKGKGVRVSTSISIPGRFCVLIPYEDKIGISKKITDFKEKRRLKKLAKDIIPENCGLIIRTASKSQSEDILSADLNYLSKTWAQVQEEVKKNSPPYLVYKDLSTTISVIRDLFTTDVSNIPDTRELIFDCEFDSKYLADNVFIDNVNNTTGLIYNLSSTYNDDDTFRDGMYVDFGEILNIDEDKEFTFSFWINLETADGRQDIIKNAFNYYFYLHNKSFYFYDYFNKSTKVLGDVESNKWYNIIIMYSKHRWRVYVNGEIVYNRLTQIKLKPSKLYISTSTNPFNGKITYMKAYNYAYSISMIKYLINHNNPNIINDIANEYENGFRCNVYDCLSVINPPATNYELLLAEKKYANHANLTSSLESDNIVVNIESTVPRIELIVAEGYIQMPDSGLYTIALNSNSICDFEIDEQSMVSWNRDDLATDSYNNSVTKYFSEGYYKYKIRYFKIQGDTEFSLGWKTPSSDSSDIVDVPKDNLYRVKIAPDTIGQFGSYNGDAYGCSLDSSFNDTLAAEVEDSTHNYYNINNLKILRYKDLTNFDDQQIFTFNFWTKINSNYAYLFAIGNQNWRDYLSGYYTNKRLIFNFQGTKLDSGIDIINKWIMISVTGNSTQITAYLNGNEIAQIEQRENDWFKYLPKFVNFGTVSSGTPYSYMSMNDFSLGDWFFDTKAYVKNDLINLYSKTKQYYV